MRLLCCTLLMLMLSLAALADEVDMEKLPIDVTVGGRMVRGRFQAPAFPGGTWRLIYRLRRRTVEIELDEGQVKQFQKLAASPGGNFIVKSRDRFDRVWGGTDIARFTGHVHIDVRPGDKPEIRFVRALFNSATLDGKFGFRIAAELGEFDEINPIVSRAPHSQDFYVRLPDRSHQRVHVLAFQGNEAIVVEYPTLFDMLKNKDLRVATFRVPITSIRRDPGATKHFKGLSAAMAEEEMAKEVRTDGSEVSKSSLATYLKPQLVAANVEGSIVQRLGFVTRNTIANDGALGCPLDAFRPRDPFVNFSSN